jgi:hypothetical protein
MGRARSKHGEKRDANRILVGKPEGKKSLGRLRRRWEDNIKLNPREKRMIWYGLDWYSSG